MNPLIFLDVNIPMYAAGKPHPYRQSCAWVMSEVASGRLSAAIDAEIVQEILYRFGSLKLWELAVAMASEVLNLIPVVLPVTQDDAMRSVALFERYAPTGISARDVVHVAVMQNNGLAEIISTDEHFDTIEGIKRLDPLSLFEEGT
jgi:predicted nucleic acid-binding protein